MKNALAFFVAVCLFCMPAAIAQIPAGLRLGVAVANWRGNAVQSLSKVVKVTDGKVSTQQQAGVYAGVFMNIPFDDVFSIEPGVYFTQKGYALKGDFQVKSLNFLGADAVARVQSSYIDLPVVVRANLFHGLQVYAGPQISYLAKNNLHLSAGVLGISLLKRDIDMTNNFKRWDAGITGGITYRFNNGINLQAGYEYGLSKLDAGSNFKSYNSVIKAGIGFTF